MSRNNVFRVGVSVGVVVIVAMFILTVYVPVSKIGVSIRNLNGMDTPQEFRAIFASVYLDGKLRTNITIQPEETSDAVSWHVEAGTHYVLVIYTHPDAPSDSPDVSGFLYAMHYKVEVFSSKMVIIELE